MEELIKIRRRRRSIKIKGRRRIIKITVIIPFPIYRPNKIMRIDIRGISPDPCIYILLKVTGADGGEHKSRFRRYYESTAGMPPVDADAGRTMQMRGLIHGHLVERT